VRTMAQVLGEREIEREVTTSRCLNAYFEPS
jgi:hypothetical protein